MKVKLLESDAILALIVRCVRVTKLSEQRSHALYEVFADYNVRVVSLIVFYFIVTNRLKNEVVKKTHMVHCIPSELSHDNWKFQITPDYDLWLQMNVI